VYLEPERIRGVGRDLRNITDALAVRAGAGVARIREPRGILRVVSLETLTLLSTACIVASGGTLLVGWTLIRRGRVSAHRNAMLTATVLAGLFLVVYVTRWSLYGSKPFAGTGGWRVLYLSILIPHIVLAMAVGPMALRLIWLALRKRDFRRHRRLARWTLPVWLFVAASGWAVYYLLYAVDF
jgi:putative membrane protein